jgi:signal peptidase II
MLMDQQEQPSPAPLAYSYSEGDEPTPVLRDILLFATLGSVLAIDQASKWFVRLNLDLYEIWPSEGFVRLTHTENSGAAFSLFPNLLPGMIFLSVIAIGLYVYVYRVRAAAGPIDRLATGLAVGGALGNLIDRVAHGAVVDFVSVGLFPIFNFADVAVIVGIGLMVVPLLSDGTDRASDEPAHVNLRYEQ